MDNADEPSRSGDDIVGQLSDAAHDLINAGRALLDGAERMLNESSQRPDGGNVEQTIHRWVQLGQAAVAGFVEESNLSSPLDSPINTTTANEGVPIVGVNITDNRDSAAGGYSDSDNGPSS